MKSLEKLMSASLTEEELLQLHAGAMEKKAFVDVNSDTNMNCGDKCKNNHCATPGLNTSVGCVSPGNPNTVLTCGGINTTLTCGGTPGGIVVNPNRWC